MHLLQPIRALALVVLSAAVTAVSTAAVQTPGKAEPRQGQREKLDSKDAGERICGLRDEIERIRFEMGRPKSSPPILEVRNAVPREIYSQALTLFQKASQLDFELTGERISAPEKQTTGIDLGLVSTVLDTVLARLLHVQANLGILPRPGPRQSGPECDSVDLFGEIVQLGRQLDLMLDRRLGPADVFEEVTLAVGYAARLLSRFPQAVRIPRVPRLERGKTPVDVYQCLLSCLSRVQDLAQAAGIPMLEIHTRAVHLENVVPSDVYDVSTLLVSELSFFHSVAPATEMPNERYFPGRRFPSHVYQRAGLLEAQLVELQKWAAARQDWLYSKR
ncbi:MAG: hypothetical protein ACE5JX_00560 [Acidobacteriota bacterium]